MPAVFGAAAGSGPKVAGMIERPELASLAGRPPAAATESVAAPAAATEVAAVPAAATEAVAAPVAAASRAGAKTATMAGELNSVSAAAMAGESMLEHFSMGQPRSAG